MPNAWPITLIAAGLVLAACSTAPPVRQAPEQRARTLPPAIPDTTGWGIHVLALAHDSTGRLWAGTYGHGIHVLDAPPRDDAPEEQAAPAQDSARADPPARGGRWRTVTAERDSIASNFVNAVALTESGAIWYGTVGSGFGRSVDGGATWRNWTTDELGPRWQYVTPNGIHVRGDTVYIATADGLRITHDGGERWSCIVGASRRAASRAAGCVEQLPALENEYLLALDVDTLGRVWVGSLSGLSVSSDGGRTWLALGESEGIPKERVRAVVMNTDSTVWVATETNIYVDSLRKRDEFQFSVATIRAPGFSHLPGAVRAMVASPGQLPPTLATSYGLAAGDSETGNFRLYYLAAADLYRPAGDLWAVLWWGPPFWPIGASSTGLNLTLVGDFRPGDAAGAPRASETAEPQHTWFGRPIRGDGANPYIDGTYRYGSTMGGQFQQHQGVEFNNPEGTPVHAIGAGVVVFAGEAEQGSNTVAIRHDRTWQGQHVFSTYYHNSAIEVGIGDQVSAGEVIAHVGSTGRATNNHLHLEVHVAPTPDSAAIVNAEERFPPHTVNPQLWVEPLPGTGVVAGRVLDAAGRLVAGARVYGLVLPYPVETPFSFAETYGDRARGDPAYDENFAVGDVPEGDYLLGVRIDDERVWRRVSVEAGRVTFVEFKPTT